MAGVSQRDGLGVLPAPFVGRWAELEELRALVQQERIVTLAGPGGVGKTRLALELVRSGDRSTPVSVAMLASIGAGNVSGALRTAVGGYEQPGRSPTDTIVERLSPGPALVVIDNCEHVIEEVAALAGELLARCPDLRVIATSREPLGLPGEVVWRVPPMDTPAADSGTSAEAVGAHDAVRLFLDRAHRVDRGFAIDETNASTLAEMTRRLDGIPLAIELAAAQVRVLSPDQILGLLGERFALLPAATRGSAGRHRTLEASVSWSYDLLDHPSQLVLQRLAVFAGGFTLEAAELVVSDEVIDESSVLPALTLLVDKSLLQVDSGLDGAKRFSMLETIRDFGLRRLDAAGVLSEVRDRHLRWCSKVGAEAEPALTGAAQLETLMMLEVEHANLQQAFEWARLTAPTIGVAMAADLTWFWKLRGRTAEGIRYLAQADVDLEPSLDRRARWSLSDLLFWSGEAEAAHELAVEVYAEALAAGDDWLAARACWELANIEALSSYSAGRSRSNEAVVLARRSGDDWCLCVSLQLGVFTALLEPETVEPLAEVTDLCERLGTAQLEAWLWAIKGRMAWDRAEVLVADECHRRGLEVARALGDPATLTVLTFGKVETLAARGRIDEALEVGREGIDYARSRGQTTYLPLLEMAVSLAEASQHARLAGTDHVGAEVAHQDGDGGWSNLAGTLAPDRTDLALARRAGADALSWARDFGHPPLVVAQLITNGLLALPDDLAASEAAIHEALAECDRVRMPLRAADALEALAVTHAYRREDLEAARLLGAAAAFKAPLGVGAIGELAAHGEAVAAAIDRVGREAWARAEQQGAAMPLDQAVALARRNRGARGRPETGWDSLTPAEERVVQLVAEGLTNREIGDRLFVTAGTVKTHLAHVFVKLGVSSRAALAATAASRPHRST